MVPSVDDPRTANYRKKIWIERKEQRFFQEIIAPYRNDDLENFGSEPSN